MGLLNLARFAAQMARTPVQLTQTVQNGSANMKFRIGLKLDVLTWIKFFNCVDQPDHPGMDQILERHLRRQAVVYSAGDVTDLRQMFEQQALALLRILHGPWRKRLRLRSTAQNRHAPGSC